MLSQAVANQVGQNENRQEVADTSRIREFLRINPPRFTCSSVTKDPKNIVEKLQKSEVHKTFSYASEMVANMRSKMSLFVAGLSLLSSREGKTAMLIGDMDIARLMIHVQQVEEEKLKDREEIQNNRAKKGMSPCSRRVMPTGHLSNGNKKSRPRFRQSFSGQGSSEAPPKFNEYNVSYPKPKGGDGGGSSLPRSTSTKCGRKHEGECLTDTDGCFGCGKSGYKKRDFPMLLAKGIEGKQDTPSGSGSNAPKQI
ncbi:uncharacterized protein LOC125856025 [Solanum stenotomum]|uniref:uncharacterized protein LOC125856025 n=1 Tax=Solanum stenotomum TaxID=172797 RepID=UPI0020D032E6|nr:uncharacterized protein LOC125856025 [Solanum stenotomum]